MAGGVGAAGTHRCPVRPGVCRYPLCTRSFHSLAHGRGPHDEARTMKVLVIGSGGREHALAWKLAQSPRISEVVVAPGNAGTAFEDKCRNVAVAATDLDGLVALARSEDVALTVVGPEAPLVAGVVDRFRAEGLRIFGPTSAAARSITSQRSST